MSLISKKVIVHLVRDGVFIKSMLHHFTLFDINLDQERKPFLELDMHEAEMFIKEIEIKIFAFTFNSVKGKSPVIMFFWLECLAVFHYGEDTDKSFIHRLVLKDL